MALSGSVSTTLYDNKVGLTCTWTATQSVTENKSILTWTLASSGDAGYQYWTGNLSLVINGNTVLYIPASERILMQGGGRWSTSSTKPVEIPHNSDGTKSFTISISAGLYYYSSSNCTGSKTFELDAIPRASSASVPNFTMGTEGTISINRANANFTHTLSVKLGNSTYQIASGVATSYAWTPALSEWGQRVPNATSAACKMIVDTYNGVTKVGTAEYGFTLHVPASAVPTISSLSVSLVNDNTTVNGWGLAVKGYTKLQWSSAASGAPGSDIKSWAFTAGGLTGAADSGTTGIIQTAGSITPSIKVTDTRDRTAAKTASAITVYDYAAPNVTNASAYRCDADGNADDSGTNVRITLTAHISSVNGKNSATLQYRYKQAGDSFNGWTAFASGAILSGFDAAKSYEVELRAIDALGNAKSTTITVPTESVWLNGKDGGKGAAFGKYAEEDNLFDVAWDSRFRGAVTFDIVPAQLVPFTHIAIAPNTSARIALSGCAFAMCRLTTAAATSGAYVLTAYSSYRSPHVATLAEGTNVAVTVGGNDDAGWYVEFTNTNPSSNVIMQVFGSISRIS